MLPWSTRDLVSHVQNECEDTGTDPELIHVEVHLDHGIRHNENRTFACTDWAQKSTTYIPLRRLEEKKTCNICSWEEVGLQYDELYWASTEKLFAGRRATRRLSESAEMPLRTLAECYQLAEKLEDVPRREPLYNETADRVADMLDGALGGEYRQHLAEVAFANLLDDADRLETQGAGRAAQKVRETYQEAIGELEESGWVLMYLTHGWERENLLHVAARRWKIAGNLYLAPRAAYAHRRRPGGGPVRAEVHLTEKPADTVLETVAALYDPNGVGHLGNLPSALVAAQTVLQ